MPACRTPTARRAGRPRDLPTADIRNRTPDPALVATRVELARSPTNHVLGTLDRQDAGDEPTPPGPLDRLARTRRTREGTWGAQVSLVSGADVTEAEAETGRGKFR